MNPELEALARRAVACSRWRWMRGMLTVDAVRLCSSGEAMELTGFPDGPKTRGFIGLPDLTDPATLGCLLALVREAWSNPDLHVQRDGRLFVVNPTPKGSPPYGDIDAPTEAAVLVAALEAAP